MNVHKGSRAVTALLCLVAVLCFTASSAVSDPDVKNVLLLHSYHQGFSWTDGVEEGIHEVLSNEPVEIYSEYLDSKRMPPASVSQAAVTYLTNKYARVKPDLLIISDNNALSFLRENRAVLFPDILIVFCGINNYSNALLEGFEGRMTGVAEKVDPSGTVRLIRRLQPKAKNLYVVTGTTPTGKAVRDEIAAALAGDVQGFDVVWLDGLPIENLLKRLSEVNPGDAVLLNLYNRDGDGVYRTYTEACQLVEQATDAPVYGMWDFYLGHGLVGGRVASSRDQGRAAGELARTILSGHALPPVLTESPNATIVMWNQLKHHDLSYLNLPPDAEIRGRPEQGRWQMLLAAGVGIFLLGLAVLGLLDSFRSCRKQTAVPLARRFKRDIRRAIILLAVTLLATVMIHSWLTAKQEAALIHDRIMNEKKILIRTMVDQAIDQVIYGRNRLDQEGYSVEEIKDIIKARLSYMSFADGEGYIFVTGYDGTELVNRGRPDLVGQNILNLKDLDGEPVVQKMIALAKNPQGGYINYHWMKPSTAKVAPKLSYVRGVQDWEWVVGAGLYVDDIASEVVASTGRYRHSLMHEAVVVLALGSLVLLLMELVARRVSAHIGGELDALRHGIADHSVSPGMYKIPEFNAIASDAARSFEELEQERLKSADAETRFRTMFEASSDSLLILDRNGICDCNPRALELFGVVYKKDLVGKHPADLSPAEQDDGRDSRAAANENIETVLQAGYCSFEWLHTRLDDGTVFPAEVILTAMVLDGRRVFQASVRDITARKQQQHELEAANSELEHSREQLISMMEDAEAAKMAAAAQKNNLEIIFNAAQVSMLLVNEKGELVRANDTAAKLVDMRVDDMLGLQICEALRCVHTDGGAAGGGTTESCPDCQLRQAWERIFSNRDAIVRNLELRHRLQSAAGEREYHFSVGANPLVIDGEPHVLLALHDITERKRAEEALSESKKRFEDLSNLLPQPIWEIDLSGRFVYTNRAGYEAMQYTPEDLESGVQVQQMFVPEDQARVMQNVQKILRGEPHEDHEYTCVRKDGSLFPALVYSTPIYREGRPVGLRGITLDITEQKQTENRLRESEQRYRLLLDTIDAGVVIIDPETHVIEHANRTAVELFGAPLDSLIGNVCHRFLCPTKAGQCPITDKHREVDRDECILLRADGSELPILKTVKSIQIDGREMLLEGFVDISELKAAEKKLADQRERLANVIEGTHAGTWEWNVQTGETIFNERWAEMVGYTLDELAPISIATWQALMHPDDLPHAQELLGRHFSGEHEYYDCEFRMRHKDGHWVWVHDRGQVVSRKNGEPLWMYGIHTDITERKKIQERLHESEQSLRAFFNTVDDLYFVATPEGTILFQNQKVVQKLEYTADELRQMNLVDLYAEKDRQKAKTIVDSMMRGERAFCPLPMMSKSGREIPVETRAWQGTWQGQACMFGVSKDLTREMETLQMFYKLFDNNPALMAVSTLPDRIYLNINDAFVRALEYERIDVIGRTAEELNLFVDPEKQNELRKKLTQSSRIDREELRIRTKSGRILTGLFSGEVIELQGEQMFLTVMTDITQQKEAEEGLRRAANVESAIADIAGYFVNVKTSEIDEEIERGLGRITGCLQLDRGYLFMLSDDEQMMSNTHEWCIEGVSRQKENLQNLPADMLPWWMKKLRGLETICIHDVREMDDQAQAVEKEVLMAQGIQSLLVVPLVWENRLEGFIGFDSVRTRHQWNALERNALEFLGVILMNAMKRRETDQALEESRSALASLNQHLEEKVKDRTRQLEEAQQQLFMQEKLASVGQLAAGIAHEINNPVGFVSMNFATLEGNMHVVMDLLRKYREALQKLSDSTVAQELQAALKQEEEKARLDFIENDIEPLLQESREGFQRITSIINSMRDFSRGETSSVKESYDINKGIRDTMVIAKNAYKYNAEVTFEPGDVYGIPCVSSQINQVILNLIVNAAQAIEGQQREGLGHIHIATWKTGDSVWCSIKDDGPGVPEKLKRKIFDPFFTTKEVGKGTGLGLSISYDIITNKHGGKFAIEDNEEGGATFVFSLPISPEESP